MMGDRALRDNQDDDIHRGAAISMEPGKYPQHIYKPHVGHRTNNTF